MRTKHDANMSNRRRYYMFRSSTGTCHILSTYMKFSNKFKRLSMYLAFTFFTNIAAHPQIK